jgi:hypothetical protein
VTVISRDLEGELVTSEALESVRTCSFEVVELSDSLDKEARERLLKRWEAELADYTSAFIGRSLTEWLVREDQVILFQLARLAGGLINLRECLTKTLP